MKHFRVSFLVTLACMAAAGWWGYEHTGISGALTAMGVAAILGVQATAYKLLYGESQYNLPADDLI